MRIGIDIRGAQHASDQPNGGLLYAKAHAIIRQAGAGSEQAVLIYDPNLPDIPHMTSADLPMERAPLPDSVTGHPVGQRASTALNGAFNSFLARLKLDIYHTLDLLDGRAQLPAHIVACPYVVTLLHDFPFVNRFDSAFVRQAGFVDWYVERMGLLMRAAHVFVPSERIKQASGNQLGLRDTQVSVIEAPGAEGEGELACWIETYRRIVADQRARIHRRDRPPRVAMWTPLRPTRSGISDYVEELLPFLVHDRGAEPPAAGAPAMQLAMELDLFSQDDATTAGVRDCCAVLPPSAFEPLHQHQPYDAVIYQIGSTPQHHRFICEQSLKHPGILVMHDPNIHSYVLDATRGGEDLPAYLDWVRRELGEGMVDYAANAWKNGTFRDDLIYRFNMDKWLVGQNRAVIYHSYFAMRDAQRRLPGVSAFYVPLYAISPERPNEHQRRRILQRHGWTQDTVLIGTYGIVAPAKRVNVLLRAFKEVAPSHPTAKLLIVGNTTHYDPRPEVAALGLDPGRVIVTGEVPMDDFLAYMQACDVGVNLRYPSLGETSAVISRLIGMGKPVITSDIPQFCELPDTFCWRVPVGQTEVETLSAYLRQLIEQPDLQRNMAQAALEYGRANMSPQLAAQGYREVAAHVFMGDPAPCLEGRIPQPYRNKADLAVQHRHMNSQ